MPDVKRGTSWFDTNIDVQVAAGGTTSAAIALLPADVLKRDVPGLTITRTLVELDIHPVVPEVVAGGQHILLGAGIVVIDAFAAGSLPSLASPSEEPTRGWIFKNSRYVFDTEGGYHPYEGNLLFLDIHSQRKLDLDIEVYFQARNTDMTGVAFSIEITGLIRMLVKLP